MVRKLIVALAVAIALALMAAPTIPGRAQAGGGHGSHRHHHHSRHFSGFIYIPDPFPYGFPNCWWEEGHWVDQLYIDKYGNETNLPQWIPGQWACWY